MIATIDENRADRSLTPARDGKYHIKPSRRLAPLRPLAKRKELAKDVDIGCNVLDAEDDAEICGACWLLVIIALSQRHEKPVAAASSRRRLAGVRFFSI